MGRGVMTVSDAVQIVYLEIDYDIDEWMLEDELEYIRDTIKAKYKSFEDANTWDGREELRVLENELAKVIVCSYMNVVSINLVPFDLSGMYNWGYTDATPLAEHWCNQIAKGFAELFPGRLIKQGTFSNGVSVYKRAIDEEDRG